MGGEKIAEGEKGVERMTVCEGRPVICPRAQFLAAAKGGGGWGPKKGALEGQPYKFPSFMKKGIIPPKREMVWVSLSFKKGTLGKQRGGGGGDDPQKGKKGKGF